MFELNAKFIILCNLAHLKDDFCLLQLGSYFSKFGLGSIVLTQVNDEISEQSNITTANQTGLKGLKSRLEQISKPNFFGGGNKGEQ